MTRLLAGILASVVAMAPALADTAAPYALPWQLRPLTLTSVARVDGAAAAFTDSNGNLDAAATTIVSGSYQLTEHWAPLLRLGFVGNDAPGAAVDGNAFGAPEIGALYTRRRGDYRLGVALSTTLPIATGGMTTSQAAMTARPTDSALFDVDHVTATVGLDVAYAAHGVTVQGEADVAPALRVRGRGDALRTTAAIALHVGYFLGSHVSVGADVRYQRAVTVAAGLRLHFGVGGHATIHPGLSYLRGFDGRGLDAPMISAQPNAVMIDVPVLF